MSTKIMTNEKWLKLADFESAHVGSADIRSATYFRVRMPDGRTDILTHARTAELAKTPDGIVYEPYEMIEQNTIC